MGSLRVFSDNLIRRASSLFPAGAIFFSVLWRGVGLARPVYGRVRGHTLKTYLSQSCDLRTAVLLQCRGHNSYRVGVGQPPGGFRTT